MKSKFLLAALLAALLSAGTYFYQGNTAGICGQSDGVCSDAIQGVERGFPFTMILDSESYDGLLPLELTGAVGNFVAWFVVALLLLFIIDFLAGIMGKLFIKIMIGLAVAGYSLFIILG